MATIAECFVRQTHRLTCVAACVAMLRRRRGADADEASVRAAWGEPPYTLLAHGRADGEYRHLDPDEPADYEILRAHVEHTWVVVLVMLEPRRPAHAIVLVQAERGSFSYLDPAEPADGQPLTMTEADFVRAWTGAALIAVL